LTDIGFVGFPGLGTGSFQWILDIWSMFVEHQSTSGTKIYNTDNPCKSSTAWFPSCSIYWFNGTL